MAVLANLTHPHTPALGKGLIRSKLRNVHSGLIYVIPI